jgi:hypothetical protein
MTTHTWVRILIPVALTIIAGIATASLNRTVANEHRLTTVEAANLYEDKALDRIDTKLDRVGGALERIEGTLGTNLPNQANR